MTEPTAYDNALRRLGLRVDPGDCFTIEWRAEREAFVGAAVSVTSCALVPAPRDPADVDAERRMSALFERIEKRCAALLRGQTAVTEPFGASGWSRNYPGLDARLEAFGGSVVLHRYRIGTIVDLGRVRDWERVDPRSAANSESLDLGGDRVDHVVAQAEPERQAQQAAAQLIGIGHAAPAARPKRRPAGEECSGT